MFINVNCPVCGTEQELKIEVVVDVETVKQNDETVSSVKSIEISDPEIPELEVSTIEISYQKHKKLSHKVRNDITRDLENVMKKYGLDIGVSFVW